MEEQAENKKDNNLIIKKVEEEKNKTNTKTNANSSGSGGGGSSGKKGKNEKQDGKGDPGGKDDKDKKDRKYYYVAKTSPIKQETPEHKQRVELDLDTGYKVEEVKVKEPKEGLNVPLNPEGKRVSGNNDLRENDHLAVQGQDGNPLAVGEVPKIKIDIPMIKENETSEKTLGA